MNFKRFHESKNLFDGSLFNGIYKDANFNIMPDSSNVYKCCKIYLDSGTYTMSFTKAVNIVRLLINGTYTENVETNVMTYTFTINNSSYFGITFRDSTSSSTVWDNSPIMLNTGGQPLPYEPYGDTWHDTPHYIHNTSTDTITTLPAVIYANDSNATVGLKGNTTQSGTPSPTNPIYPSGCGDKTANLLDIQQYNPNNVSIDSQGRYVAGWGTGWCWCIPLEIGKTYTVSVTTTSDYKNSTALEIALCRGYRVIYNASISYVVWVKNKEPFVEHTLTITFVADADWLSIVGMSTNISKIMIIRGLQAPQPYEPYGYKIPISSASTTTNIYLGEAQTTRRVKKYEFTGNENFSVSSTDSKTRIGYAGFVNEITVSSSTLCSHYKYKYASNIFPDVDCFMFSSDKYMWIGVVYGTTVSDFKSYLAAQYAAGTPVTVWYVLATEETGIVNEPLMKIGNYADSISGISIPTIAGANTLDVQTTVKPSEVTASFNGWHPVTSAHERESGAWT